MHPSSMTAYGFGEQADGPLTYSCEIRSLNSRYLEVSVRLPRHLMPLETELVNHVKTKLRRGKVDIFIDCNKAGATRDLPSLDHEVLTHYAKLLGEASIALRKTSGAELGQVQTSLNLGHLLSMEGVLATGDGRKARGQDAAEGHRVPLFKALDAALTAAIQARKKEGESLEVALLELLSQMETGRNAVAAKHDAIMVHLHKTYVKRLESFLATLAKAGQPTVSLPPEERILAEVAVLADKCDIDEELTRLATHLAEFKRLMTSEEASGRKLDFLCQEMHREVNTMSNKLVQTEVAQHTIEMKQTVERIRQQVQNIE